MKNNEFGHKTFVRREATRASDPPATSKGLWGFLWTNLFASMADFSSIESGCKSILMALLTIVVLWLGISQIIVLIDFAFVSAVWSDSEGLKREVCATEEQGGTKPNGWSGACWPFITVKLKYFVYGRYPIEELWRVNSVLIVGFFSLAWVMIEGLPKRSLVGLFLLTIYPLGTLIMLSGGNFDVGDTLIESGFQSFSMGLYLQALESWSRVHFIQYVIFGIIILAIIKIVISCKGDLGFKTFIGFWKLLAFGLILLSIVIGITGIDFGYWFTGKSLTVVDTRDWGGLLITLVVAVTANVASLPIGILLALGRRSSLPIARVLSTAYIEFWRGVPLISVLFMAAAMLPLFLPEGVNFDNLLRALVGFILWQSAYIAETVRGGLQAIDKGQYEGAQAIGLPYWQSMRRVILPQALTHVIPSLVNSFITTFKDTTFVAIVGIFDLLGTMRAALTDVAWATPVQDKTGYIFAGTIFFIFCFGMSRYSLYVERQLSRSKNR